MPVVLYLQGCVPSGLFSQFGSSLSLDGEALVPPASSPSCSWLREPMGSLCHLWRLTDPVLTCLGVLSES